MGYLLSVQSATRQSYKRLGDLDENVSRGFDFTESVSSPHNKQVQEVVVQETLSVADHEPWTTQQIRG